MTNQVDLSVDFVDVRGKKIQVLKGGQGETLLYLHSAGGETFPLPFHEALAEHFSLIAPAHPGFDQSTGIEKINDIEDLAFYYLEFLDAMKLDKVYIAGTSLGGWLAMELAVRWPERFKKIVLVNSVGIWLTDSPMAEMFGLEPAELRELCFYDPKSDIAQALIQDEPPEELLFLMLKGLETTARLAWNPYLHNPKLHDRLYRINVPTLIIWGEHDKLVPLAYGHALNKAISNSKLEIIKECGHMPIFEKTPEFVELLVNFIKSN